jgi:predicted ATPase with chaperone activity
MTTGGSTLLLPRRIWHDTSRLGRQRAYQRILKLARTIADLAG